MHLQRPPGRHRGRTERRLPPAQWILAPGAPSGEGLEPPPRGASARPPRASASRAEARRAKRPVQGLRYRCRSRLGARAGGFQVRPDVFVGSSPEHGHCAIDVFEYCGAKSGVDFDVSILCSGVAKYGDAAPRAVVVDEIAIDATDHKMRVARVAAA